MSNKKLSDFTFRQCKTLVCEAGAAYRLASHILPNESSFRSIYSPSSSTPAVVLIITDPGIVKAGLLSPMVKNFEDEKINVEVFDGVLPDPPDTCMMAAAKKAIAVGAQGIIGLGGGSSMDVAKVVAYLVAQYYYTSSVYKESEQFLAKILESMYGVEQCRGAVRLPLAQVPTTAGTGSEMTTIAVVTVSRGGSKKGIVSAVLLPDVAILDASLTLSMPARITAMTGIDGMCHAIEALTCKTKKNSLSDALAMQALVLLGGNIREACSEVGSKNLDARSKMLLGASYAGMAFANSPVGAVHALAYPLGTQYKLPHGLSISLMLPHVIRFNAFLSPYSFSPAVPVSSNSTTKQKEIEEASTIATSMNDIYWQINNLIFPKDIASTLCTVTTHRGGGVSSCSGGGLLAENFLRLARELKLPTTLNEAIAPSSSSSSPSSGTRKGLGREAMESLAQGAMGQSRLLPNNPRKVGMEDCRKMFFAAASNSDEQQHRSKL